MAVSSNHKSIRKQIEREPGLRRTIMKDIVLIQSQANSRLFLY